MFPTDTHYLYDFCQEPWARVAQALRDLVMAKTKFAQRDTFQSERLFGYVEPLLKLLEQGEVGNEWWETDRASINFLDSNLIGQYLKNPRDTIVSSALAVEVVILHAAVGLLRGVEPYTPAEVAAIGRGEAPTYYNDWTFAYTLRRILSGTAPEEYVPIIMWWLSKKQEAFGQEQHDWAGAVIFTLILQVAWSVFVF